MGVISPGEPACPPSPPVQITGATSLSTWGHTDIDDLLLEAGIDGLSAERGLGSRRDRANAIVKFSFEHPSETTADNSLFSVFLVNRAFSGTSVTDDVAAEALPAGGGSEPLREFVDARVQAIPRSPHGVFVVHGHNDTARQEVVSFLDAIGLKGIVLHDQPNMGRHLLTKLIEEAELVTFAIVLMTDDDLGSKKGEALAPRARQNVILELGYFLSHLGQARICALVSPGLDTPSDFDGIVYIRMDADGNWRATLKRELQAAGMPVTGES